MDSIQEWIFHGFLNDKYCEFFIKMNENKSLNEDLIWREKFILSPIEDCPYFVQDESTLRKVFWLSSSGLGSCVFL